MKKLTLEPLILFASRTSLSTLGFSESNSGDIEKKVEKARLQRQIYFIRGITH